MSSARILLADDEVEFTTTLSKVLRRRGYTADVASDGPAALDALRRAPYDVLILDVKMPHLDGIQILALLKRMTLPTEVILLTGHLSVQEEDASRKLGAFAYVLKPLPFSELLSMIDAAAARARIESDVIPEKPR